MKLLVCILFGILSSSSEALESVANSEEFELKLRVAGDDLVLAVFTDQECGPCKVLLPTLQTLKVEFPQVMFLEIDVQEAEDVAVPFNIEAMPTIIIFRKSEKIEEMRGVMSESQLKERIQALLP